MAEPSRALPTGERLADDEVGVAQPCFVDGRGQCRPPASVVLADDRPVAGVKFTANAPSAAKVMMPA